MHGPLNVKFYVHFIPRQVFAVNNKSEAADSQRAKYRDACKDSPDKVKIQWFLFNFPVTINLRGNRRRGGDSFLCASARRFQY